MYRVSEGFVCLDVPDLEAGDFLEIVSSTFNEKGAGRG